MARVDATQAECRVFTFKEGVLSAIAHDLELTVERFAIEVGADLSLDARFEAASVRVLHALRDGRPTTALSAADRRKIDDTIRDEVLQARRYPEIVFRAPPPRPLGSGFELRGELSLVGRTRAVVLRSHLDGERQLAEVLLHQPDFGITPFHAMLGALRVEADVKVRVAMPWPLPG